MFGRSGPKHVPAGRPAPPGPDRGGANLDETVVIRPGGVPPSRPPAGPAEPAARRAPESRARPGAAPRHAASGTRLVDLAAQWFGTVLALGRVLELPDPAAIRSRALALKAQLERGAAEAGMRADDVEAAVFALVAFLDETVLNVRGAARDVWLTRPLQLELYRRNDAGEVFFDRLEALRARRESGIEALEVYYACLLFGFAGRYRLSPAERLAALTADVGRDVEAVRGAGASVLSPNARRPSEKSGAGVSGLPRWLTPAAFAGAVLLGWLVVWLLHVIKGAWAAGALERLG
jgi:type VI secretion system protein ImpK